MNAKLYLFCGIPFSGKSTLAKKISEIKYIPVVDFDEVKFDLYGKGTRDENLMQKDWDLVFKETYGRIENLLMEGKSLIYDMGNFTKADRKKIRNIAGKYGIGIITVFIDTPYEIAKKRYLENKRKLERFDIAEEDFNSACAEMEPPGVDEAPVLIYHLEDDPMQWISKNIT